MDDLLLPWNTVKRSIFGFEVGSFRNFSGSSVTRRKVSSHKGEKILFSFSGLIVARKALARLPEGSPGFHALNVLFSATFL